MAQLSQAELKQFRQSDNQMTANRDGKELEQLVAFVEETLVPKGFDVKLNKKVFDEGGNQLAEFDIQVRGKVGTGEIAWLIECRDRPSEGAAPGSWIDQLAGRRARFNFNKVTAVSTTGFSASARASGDQHGIDLREVSSISASEFSWLQMEHLVFQERVIGIRHITVNIVEECLSEIVKAEVGVIVKASSDQTPFLVNSTGGTACVRDVFTRMVEKEWDALVPDAPPRSLKVLANFREQDRFHINTSQGEVPVGSIIIEGEVSIRQTLIASETFKYHDAKTGEVISELVKFPFSHGSTKVTLEMHRITGASEMPIVVRRQDKPKN